MYHRRRERRGIQVLMLVLCAAAVAAACALVQSQRSDTLYGWTRRTVLDLRVRDALVSATSECWYEAMTAANQPGALYGRLRQPGAAPFTFNARLPVTRADHLGDTSRGAIASIEACARFGTLAPAGAVPGQYRTVVAVEVDVVTRMPRARHRMTQLRELRVTSLAAPVPAAALCGGTLRGAAPTLEDPVAWRAVAPLVIAPAGPRTAQSEFDLLTRLLDAVNGTVLIDNGPGDPLRLTGRAFRGRAVLVVRGPVELQDVRPEDPARDQLTVIALSDVKLAGDLHLALLLGHAAGTPAPVHSVAPGARVHGGLCALSGDLPDAGLGLDCDASAYGGPFPGAAPRPDQLQVVFAPALVASGMEVLP